MILITFLEEHQLVKTESRVVSNLNEEVWCYNFKEKKWHLIGTFLRDHIIPIYTSFTKGSKFIYFR